MENFGRIGSFIFSMSVGFSLRRLRSMNSALSRPIYSMISAALAFTFWRDDFSISIVKVMIEDAMLFSVGIYYLGALFAELIPSPASVLRSLPNSSVGAS
jgi:hypothetical protein